MLPPPPFPPMTFTDTLPEKRQREGWGYLTLVWQFKGLTDCHLHHFLKRPYKSYLSK